MESFADRLQNQIQKANSKIVAGIDPIVENLPKKTNLYDTLVEFYAPALEAIAEKVAAVKANIAFFEQYGIEGMRAFLKIRELVRRLSVPFIADAKRGDIGSTAQAYSNAFLASSKDIETVDADALTVNPFLGFDTLEPFLGDCVKFGKGIFVLVQTSNPGSNETQLEVRPKISSWINSKSMQLLGNCGYSGLGAVVGATYPDEAKALRKQMPQAFFLVPGFGAQGASAIDALAGLDAKQGGVIVNVSRGLFSPDLRAVSTNKALQEMLGKKIDGLNLEINSCLRHNP